jgi:elongation factor P--(R)-beta-lysine ligase
MLTQQELHLRAAFFAAIRSFFNEKNFLEVDTPLRQPVILPESNIVPLMAGGHFLQTSPELCMKRLLASGCTRIFQICPCFRKEELGRHHLEEFSMLEWYRTDADYSQLMDDCEQLLIYVLEQLLKRCGYQDEAMKKSIAERLGKLKKSLPWRRLTVKEAFDLYSPDPLEKVLAQGVFDERLVEYVEPELGKSTPVFLFDYPSEMASLARKSEVNPYIAERFELFYQGLELANGFSELTDSREQRARFTEELSEIERQQRETGGMQEKFLADLTKIDTAAGIALGTDRLFMLVLGKERVEEAVTFAPGDFLGTQ